VLYADFIHAAMVERALVEKTWATWDLLAKGVMDFTEWSFPGGLVGADDDPGSDR